jgi:hypothetical protein
LPTRERRSQVSTWLLANLAVARHASNELALLIAFNAVFVVAPTPRIKARLADLGSTALAGSPAGFGKLIADDDREMGQSCSGRGYQAAMNAPTAKGLAAGR